MYCLEQADNGAELAGITLPRDARLSYVFDRHLFDGVGTIGGTRCASILRRGMANSISRVQPPYRADAVHDDGNPLLFLGESPTGRDAGIDP